MSFSLYSSSWTSSGAAARPAPSSMTGGISQICFFCNFRQFNLIALIRICVVLLGLFYFLLPLLSLYKNGISIGSIDR